MVTQRVAPKSAAKRTRRGPYTRQQILDASLRLFSERGFARTTVRDIARQAGITDAAIYYHFESKRELLEALVEKARAKGLAAMVGGIDSANAASIALHERAGFEIQGCLKGVGRKFGKSLDLVFMVKQL